MFTILIQCLVDEHGGEGLLGAIVSFSADARVAKAAWEASRELRKDLESFAIQPPAAVPPFSGGRFSSPDRAAAPASSSTGAGRSRGMRCSFQARFRSWR